VQKIPGRRQETDPVASLAEIAMDWAQFQIIPILMFQGSLQIVNQKIQFLVRLAKRFAMI
jgi:hypothetical protein